MGNVRVWAVAGLILLACSDGGSPAPHTNADAEPRCTALGCRRDACDSGDCASGGRGGADSSVVNGGNTYAGDASGEDASIDGPSLPESSTPNLDASRPGSRYADAEAGEPNGAMPITEDSGAQDGATVFDGGAPGACNALVDAFALAWERCGRSSYEAARMAFADAIHCATVTHYDVQKVRECITSIGTVSCESVNGGTLPPVCTGVLSK